MKYLYLKHLELFDEIKCSIWPGNQPEEKSYGIGIELKKNEKWTVQASWDKVAGDGFFSLTSKSFLILKGLL